MTRSLCDQVTERVALGEALGELTEHVATCADCQRLVAMSSRLGATHHAVDPGLGFSARMTVGAQHRIAVRRRRRFAMGLAATVASGAFGVFVMTRAPELPPNTPMVQMPEHRAPEQPDPWADPPPTDDEELAALVQLADVDHASRLSAKWSRIKKPLAPYKQLLEGEAP